MTSVLLREVVVVVIASGAPLPMHYSSHSGRVLSTTAHRSCREISSEKGSCATSKATRSTRSCSSSRCVEVFRGNFVLSCSNSRWSQISSKNILLGLPSSIKDGGGRRQQIFAGNARWAQGSRLPRSSRTGRSYWSSARSGFGLVSSDSNSSYARRRGEKSEAVSVVGGARYDQGKAQDEESGLSRRATVLLLLASAGLSAARCDAASAAFSLGFPGVKDWLRGQKQKTASFLLAPINASRDRLSTALLLISSDDVSNTSYEEAESLVKVAARDCMPLEAGSILDFQSRSGVEVCTFRLVLKNAASLLDSTDPAKVKAEESLKELIRSFVTLDDILAAGVAGGSPDRKSLVGALAETSGALDRFEGGVRACLGIA